MYPYYEKVIDEINYRNLTGKERFDFYKMRFYDVLMQAVNENKLYIDVLDKSGKVFLSTKGNENSVTIKNTDVRTSKTCMIDQVTNYDLIPNMVIKFKMYKKNILDKTVNPTQVQIICEDTNADTMLIFKKYNYIRLKSSIVDHIKSTGYYDFAVKIYGQNSIYFSPNAFYS